MRYTCYMKKIAAFWGILMLVALSTSAFKPDTSTPPAKEEKMKLEIWSDVACPWCYIGKRRFEEALDQFEHADEIEIVWKSFQLNPEQKTGEFESTYAYLANKMHTSEAQAKQMTNQVTEVAKTVGLHYDFDQVVEANTFRAHQMIHYANTVGKQDVAKERLLKAHFEEGKNVDDINTLLDLGVEIGLDRNALNEVLNNNTYASAVKGDIQEAQQIGVRGVPFFVFDRTYGVSGAQQADVFLETLTKAYNEWKAKQPQPQLKMVDGKVCTPDGICD